MKKVFVILFAAAALVACKENKKTSEAAGEVAQSTETAATYTVDAAASTLGWTGSKVVSGKHNGSIAIQNGELKVENGNIVAGNFTIDMKTITVLDEEKDKAKLVGHLSSPDFFHVDSFPTASFEVSEVKALEGDANGNTHTITGNLTLKGVSRKISFPAKVSITETGLTATAKTEINRLEWNVMWGNENDNAARSFLKENFLSNMIGLDINLVAKK